MIDAYVGFVKQFPLLSSALQIGILGTIGELIAVRIRMGKWYFFGPGPWKLIAKAIVWAFLGITFKYIFTGFFGFVAVIVKEGWWFDSAGTNIYVRALSVSFFANIIYGPIFTTFHRFTDNYIEKRNMDWSSMKPVWWSLIWLWIPALTIIFCLPKHLQIGFLALLNILLGLVLGFFAAKKKN